MIDLYAMTREELRAFVCELGEGKFRADQLALWLHKGTPIDEMSNLSKAFREKLKAAVTVTLPEVEEKYVSRIDGV